MVASVALFGLRSLEGQPVPAATVERTIHGITMTIPEGWHLIDPVETGLQPPDDGFRA